MNTKKSPDDNLLDAQLDFILNAPQEQFEQYLIETGSNVTEMNARATFAFERALDNHTKSKAADALANLTPAEQKVVAHNLRIRRSVLTAFREHRVDVSSIPQHFLSRLANELGQAVGSLVHALREPAPRALTGQYKSDVKPEGTFERIPFEQLLREAAMSEEEINQLIRNGG